MRPPLEREPMSVGLNRNQKKRRPSLPMWLEEKIGWMAIIGCALLLGLPFKLMYGGEVPTTPPTDPKEQAHISVVYGPTKKWANGSSTHLIGVSAILRNTGPASARHVLVTATVRGTTLALSGPITLAPGQSETYSAVTEMNVVSRDPVTTTYVCWNCPLTPGPAPTEGEAVAPWNKEQAALTGKH